MNVRAILSDVPPLSDFEPFGVYCTWEITLVAPGLGEDAIREVFEFVEGDCDIIIAQAGTVPGLVSDESEMAADVSAEAATDGVGAVAGNLVVGCSWSGGIASSCLPDTTWCAP